MTAVCVWAKSGDIVTETRSAWKTENPLGPCEQIVQRRNCTCGGECDDFSPPGFSACTNGCGSAPHGEVVWSEKRIRYAQPIARDVCRSQTQGIGTICHGSFGGLENASEKTISWCVVLGNRCASTTALFLFENCSMISDPPSPPEATPGKEHSNEVDHNYVIIIACGVAAGVLLLSAGILVVYFWCERHTGQRGTRG